MQLLRFRFRAWILVACCSLLAGCAVPGNVQATVKVGLSAPFEGLYRDFGYEVLNAVRLAVRQRNERGGVGGRYLVEQVSLDDYNEAGEAARQAHEMAVDPGIVGVLGGWSPQTSVAARPEYAQAGLAFVAPEMDPDSLAEKAASIAARDGPAPVALVLYASDPADRDLAEAFVDAFVQQGGTVANAATPTDDRWTRELGLIDGRHPDIIFVAADALTAAGWMVAVRDAGFQGTVVGGPALGSSLVVDVAGEASEGVVFVSPFPPPIRDSAFVDAYQELSGGALPGPAASWAYDAANRLLDTIDRSVREREPSLRAAVEQTWIAGGGGPDELYSYVIQSGKIYTPYVPR